MYQETRCCPRTFSSTSQTCQHFRAILPHTSQQTWQLGVCFQAEIPPQNSIQLWIESEETHKLKCFPQALKRGTLHSDLHTYFHEMRPFISSRVFNTFSVLQILSCLRLGYCQTPGPPRTGMGGQGIFPWGPQTFSRKGAAAASHCFFFFCFPLHCLDSMSEW